MDVYMYLDLPHQCALSQLILAIRYYWIWVYFYGGTGGRIPKQVLINMNFKQEIAKQGAKLLIVSSFISVY